MKRYKNMRIETETYISIKELCCKVEKETGIKLSQPRLMSQMKTIFDNIEVEEVINKNRKREKKIRWLGSL